MNGAIGACAIDFRYRQQKPNVTFGAQNIMKFTEMVLWSGLCLGQARIRCQDLDGGPWQVIEKDGHKIVIKDSADAFLQQNPNKTR